MDKLSQPSLAKALSAAWFARLNDGCQDLGIELTEFQIHQIGTYVEALYKWNKAYNLTAVKNVDDMLVVHVLDSLSVVEPLLHYIGERIVDVGTGAGLPGLLLAIVYPQLQVHLLDTNGKKTRFLMQCTHQLGLDNVTVINQRVEQYQAPVTYDVVISRAFAAINDMLIGCQHLLAKKGVFAAMKGQYPTQEIAHMPTGFVIEKSVVLTVPSLNAKRHLLFIKTTQSK